jgi:hypothetical protein
MNSGRIRVFHGGLVRLNIILFSSRGSRPACIFGGYYIVVDYIQHNCIVMTYNLAPTIYMYPCIILKPVTPPIA